MAPFAMLTLAFANWARLRAVDKLTPNDGGNSALNRIDACVSFPDVAR
jgi:hypothetical protein